MPRLKSFVPTLISEQEYKVYEENGTKTVEQIVTSKYSERQFPNISENVTDFLLIFRILRI